MNYFVVLFVLVVGLRRHPQEQHVRTTALSAKWICCLSESDRNVGPIPIATEVGVTCSPGKGCIGPESTNAQQVAYGKVTVYPYLYILYLSPVWVPSTVLPPLYQKANRHGQDPCCCTIVVVALCGKLKAIHVCLNLLVYTRHPYSIELTHLFAKCILNFPDHLMH